MLLFRRLVERLILLLLGVARRIFILQGVAFGCASLAAFLMAPPEAPAWLRGAMISALFISCTFFVAGFLMAERRWRATHERGVEPAWPWPLLLGLSLVMLPVVAAIAASALLPLWRTIAAQLAAVGFWDAVARNDPYGGIVLLPILVALFVPVLVSAASLISVAFPLTMLPLFAARSRMVPTLLARGTICQVAAVLTSLIAVDAFARLAAQAMVAMTASGDAEVLRVSQQLDAATAILTRTAIALVLPALGMLAWLAFLRPSGAAAAFFTSGASWTPPEAVEDMAAESVPPRPWIAVAPVAEIPVISNRDSATTTREPGTGVTRLARLALATLGALMLMFGAADGLRTRAFYVSSTPPPGARLAEAPTTVRVTFGAELDPSSTLSLTRLVVQPSAGEEPRRIDLAPRLAPDDLERQTIEAAPSRLTPGVYRVTWQALPAGGGVPRHGSFSFGIGVPVPADTTGMALSLQDRDAGARGRRQTIMGGVLLLVLGALLPWLSTRA